MSGLIDRLCNKLKIIISSIEYKNRVSQGKKIVRRYDCNFTKKDLQDKVLHVLVNGPSLNRTIGMLTDKDDCITVNLSYKDERIKDIKPKYHVLVDERYATDTFADTLADIMKLLEARIIGCLVVSPVIFETWKKYYPTDYVRIINLRSIENEYASKRDYKSYCNDYLAPSSQTVTIAAVYIGIQEGYGTIKLHGNDFTWINDLTVGSDNRVYNNTRHFYGGDESVIQKRITPLTMTQWAQSFNSAFVGYNQLAAYAKDAGVKIINMCPESLVDVFEKE